MNIALIEFTENSKKYYFSIPNNLIVNINDFVVVETVVGLELGKVYNIKDEKDLNIIKNLKPIIRIATDKDKSDYRNNIEDSLDVIFKTKELIKHLDLDMAVLDANYTLERDRLTISFKSEGRVDFRNLVRELSSIYKTRIELRQVGPRDVAKLIGGLGPCGLVLCCNNFIGEFDAVTIKMAKNQELSLNPRTISGVCGKLLCCLKYEDEVYDEMKELMPDLWQSVNTEKGLGKVIDINFISGKIKVKYKDEDLIPEWIDYRLVKE